MILLAFQRIPADQPAPRTDHNSQLAHEQLLNKARKGGIDVYFEGDSIIRRWGTSDVKWRANYENWKTNFFGWNAADFGWGADATQNILWRLDHGEIDGVNPKVIVVLAGTNNVGAGESAEEVARGVRAIVDRCRKKAPKATIVLTAIFPRNDNPAYGPTIEAIDADLAKRADRHVQFLNVNAGLADASGKLRADMTIDGLHPSPKGYQTWADGLNPILQKILGPRAANDHAPPPTGDPSAKPPA